MLNIFTLIHRLILQALYGGIYACWHVASDGSQKVFWTDTLEDAMQWVACCLNDETAKIVKYNGELVAMRHAC